MKIALFVAAAMALPTLAMGGEFAHMVIFNSNQVEAGKSCTPGNWQKVMNTISIAAADVPNRRRRGLKGQFSSNRERRLACTNCGIYCGYGGTGCPKSGRRRRTLDQVDDIEPRDLQVGDNHDIVEVQGADTVATLEACNAKIPNVEAGLVNLIPVLQGMEPSCAALVASSRDITCHESTTDCDVSSVSLVSADTNGDVVADVLPKTGATVCSTEKVTFHAETEFDTGRVDFVVKGTAGYKLYHTDVIAPTHSLEAATSESEMATAFPVGNYTMTVTSEYDLTHSKTFSFKSIQC